MLITAFSKDLPGGSDGKASVYNAGDPGSPPGVGRFPWRRKWQSTPVLLPGKPHGQWSLIGYSPWGHKESDTTERLHSQHLVESVTSQLKEIHEPLFCVLQAECHLWRISKESLQFTRTFYQTVIIISTNFLNILCL